MNSWSTRLPSDQWDPTTPDAMGAPGSLSPSGGTGPGQPPPAAPPQGTPNAWSQGDANAWLQGDANAWLQDAAVAPPTPASGYGHSAAPAPGAYGHQGSGQPGHAGSPAPSWGSTADPAQTGWAPSPQPVGAPPGFGSVPAAPPSFGGTAADPSSGGLSGLQIGLIVVSVIVVLGGVAGWFVARSVSGLAGQIPAALLEDGTLEPGFTYGDNPTLDALWDSCEAGVYGDCDTLYFISEFDSDYEAFGDSCGNRNVPAGLCTGIYGD